MLGYKMKDYTTIDARDIQMVGIPLIKEINRKCDEGFKKIAIWSPLNIPSKLRVTDDQFREFIRLQGGEYAKPTGKELFQTKKGYVLEIKVDQ